jgi:hypothetical protein
VQDEVDRLAVILLDQLFELHEGFGEGVIIVELHRAIERDDLRLSPPDPRKARCRDRGCTEASKYRSALHGCVSSSIRRYFAGD